LCINLCIYLWPAIPPVFLAESNFRFRCYLYRLQFLGHRIEPYAAIAAV
jgi:hypothetical protein